MSESLWPFVHYHLPLPWRESLFIREHHGAHKTGLLIESPSLTLNEPVKSIVLLEDAARIECLVSGQHVRQQLKLHGAPTPTVHVVPFFIDILGKRWACSVESWLPGIELEHFHGDMWKAQHIDKMAHQVADLVKLSTRALGTLNSKGWGSHLYGRPPKFNDVFGFERMVCTLAQEKGEPYRSWGFRCLSWLDAMKHKMIQVPRCVMIWDVLDRNILWEGSHLTGVIDQDDILTGDIWIVPAWSNVLLAHIDCPWTDMYMQAWLKRWNMDDSTYERFLWHRAFAGFYMSLRQNQYDNHGRSKSKISWDQAKQWLDEVASLVTKHK